LSGSHTVPTPPGYGVCSLLDEVMIAAADITGISVNCIKSGFEEALLPRILVTDIGENGQSYGGGFRSATRTVRLRYLDCLKSNAANAATLMIRGFLFLKFDTLEGETCTTATFRGPLLKSGRTWYSEVTVQMLVKESTF